MVAIFAINSDVSNAENSIFSKTAIAIDVIVHVKLVHTIVITVQSVQMVSLKLKFLENVLNALKSVYHAVTLPIVQLVSLVMLSMIPYAKSVRMTIVTIAH
jgi:hypothetical protein